MTQKTVKQYITVMSHSVEGVRIQVNENIEFGFQPLGGIAGVNLMKLMFGFKRWLGTKISNTLVHLKCATECYHIVVT